jgi:hypothetical protein
MVVAACAEEADQVTGGFVRVGQFLQFGRGFHFGQRGGQVEHGETMPGGNGLEQIVQTLDANGLEHRVPLGGGDGDVGHGGLQV